jgi:hypothetical protein
MKEKLPYKIAGIIIFFALFFIVKLFLSDPDNSADLVFSLFIIILGMAMAGFATILLLM